MNDRLYALLEPTILGLGYELVGIELEGGQRKTLRVYIDKEEGITLSDCQKVSYQVSGVLEVEDPVPGAYQLEISSPGLARPLFKKEDFTRFAGREIKIRLASAEKRKKIRGILKGLEAEQVLIESEGELLSIPIGHIQKAHLIF